MTQLVMILIGIVLSFTRHAGANQNELIKSQYHGFSFETLTRQSDVIWGFDFLDADRMIFTERGGKLKILNLKTQKVEDITGAPDVYAGGQGGLLDVRVFEKKIFLSYSEKAGDKSATAVASADLVENKLTNFKKIFTAEPAASSAIHFGSRIEFDQEKNLFVTIGERNERKMVQDLKTHLGKIIRIRQDGRPSAGNPYIGKADAKPEIWSYGHRSPQGLVIDRRDNSLWMAEMGPRGGDEINLISVAGNYGWPDVTYGKEYSGGEIGPGTKPGVTEPVTYWVPSISPSAIHFYTGAKFNKWTGDLFVATLSGTHLRRLRIKDKKVVEQESLLADKNLRFRNVRTGPDGFLYVSTDQGHIARLKPQ